MWKGQSWLFPVNGINIGKKTSRNKYLIFIDMDFIWFVPFASKPVLIPEFPTDPL
jgi:hypothetical protein